jgi:hypothetical protein
MVLDRYDYLILDIIHAHRKQHRNATIKLGAIEHLYWSRLKHDHAYTSGDAQLGERIARLYLHGYIQNRQGYSVTRKGKSEMLYQMETLD